MVILAFDIHKLNVVSKYLVASPLDPAHIGMSLNALMKRMYVLTSDPPEFAFVEIVGNKPCNVGSDAVANEMQGVWRNATGVFGEVIHQLSDALRPEPWSPVDLAEARFLG